MLKHTLSKCLDGCSDFVLQIVCKNDQILMDQLMKLKTLHDDEILSHMPQLIQKNAGAQDFSERVKQFADLVEKHGIKTTRMLDICCGDGQLTKLISQKLHLEAFGVDQLDQTPDFQYHKTDLNTATSLPFGKFDLITMQAAFHHVHDKENVLKLIQESLSENGILIMYDFLIENELNVHKCDLFHLNAFVLGGKILAEKYFTDFYTSYVTEEMMNELSSKHGFKVVEYLKLNNMNMNWIVLRKK